MDAETIVESAASAETQAAAEKIGWIPPARYKGEVERFVDAEEYIKRGETVLPIVKRQLQDTKAELERVRLDGAKTAQALKSAQDAIDVMEERHSVETQKAVENARTQLKVQLAKASEAGDHEAVAELTEELTRANAVLDKPADKKVDDKKVETFVPPADLVDWNKENEWFGKNRRLTALALGIAQELREAGETVQGRAFFDKIGKEMEQYLPKRSDPVDKVEGARNGAEGEQRTSSKKGYASLPADAKAACDADIKKFVGEGKRYKTAADWRAQFATLYFSE